jgi:hypothetical protein
MAYVPLGPKTSNTIGYEAPPGVLVYLIGQSVNGARVRRLAAHFILNCLRSYRTPDETVACLHTLEHGTLLDLAADVEKLSLELGLITAPVGT